MFRTVRVEESVPGQNLSTLELSDQTHHTPGTGPVTEPGGLTRRRTEAPTIRLQITGVRLQIEESEVEIKRIQ